MNLPTAKETPERALNQNLTAVQNAAISIIVALGGLRQEDHRFKASLSYIAKPCLKRKMNKGLVV